MADPARARLAAGAHQWAAMALALVVIGPSILLVYAWVEVLNHPGLSLVDGYRIGRLPWTPIGIVTSLAGGAMGLVAGSVAIAIEGGWWRRALLVPAAAAAALWWLTALAVIPYPRFQGPDPVAFANALPSTAALLVLMPAALLAILALSPPTPGAPRMHMRRVAVPEPSPGPWRDDAEERPDLEP
ncbi:MAG: hypothetical protein M3R32_04115 [Chloroflexota bacterium]|nr:hypothetical protein [Chloroflexota bacterium]